MAVSKRLRYEVLRRDNHTCRYCGAQAPDVKLTVDHVVPIALGGKDEAGNLVTACAPCNSGKTSSTPDASLIADVDADALRWASARTQAISRWRLQQRELGAALHSFGTAWDGWSYGPDDARRPIPRDAGWEDSVERWLEEGLDVGDLSDLIPKAMHNKPGRSGGVIAPEDRWRYYCGVVWRTLDQIQEATRAQIDSPSGPAPSDPGTYEVGFEAGFLQGRATCGCQQSQPGSDYETGVDYGFRSALDWAIAGMWEPPPEPQPCPDCGERDQFGTTGRCLPCWRDALEPREPPS